GPGELGGLPRRARPAGPQPPRRGGGRAGVEPVDLRRGAGLHRQPGGVAPAVHPLRHRPLPLGDGVPADLAVTPRRERRAREAGRRPGHDDEGPSLHGEGRAARSGGSRPTDYSLPEARAPSRSSLSWEMVSSGMPLGQTAAHSPRLVQPPKSSSSCWLTIFTTREARSGCPCGSMPRWVTLAAVHSIAEPFGQAAPPAPQPMQVAASKARSASALGTGVACASGAVPVGALMYPPAWMMRSKALRSTTRSLMTGNALARHGSTSM